MVGKFVNHFFFAIRDVRGLSQAFRSLKKLFATHQKKGFAGPIRISVRIALLTSRKGVDSIDSFVTVPAFEPGPMGMGRLVRHPVRIFQNRHHRRQHPGDPDYGRDLRRQGLVRHCVAAADRRRHGGGDPLQQALQLVLYPAAHPVDADRINHRAAGGAGHQ